MHATAIRGKPGRKGKIGKPIPAGAIEKGGGRTDKWADYVIFKVHYPKARHPHIEAVGLREDHGAWFGPLRKWSRDEVISAVKKHKRFVTLDSGRLKKGELEKGEDVLLIRDDRYLRTRRTEDNLEDLDQF